MNTMATGSPTVSASRPSRILGLRPVALIEIALFLALALATDRWLFQGDRFQSVAPHPFWILVLLVSAQYGTREGLLAAALSSVALLAFHLPDPAAGPDPYAGLLALVRRPVSWMVVAFVLGELRQRQIRRETDLALSLETALRREAELRSACESLDRARRELETFVAGQPATLLSVCRAAPLLESTDPARTVPGAIGLVRAVLNPARFSLFLRREGGLHLAAQHGWAEGDSWRRAFPDFHPLARAILEEGRCLSAARPEDDAALAGEGILAAPLRDPGGAILGMLKIEDPDLARGGGHTAAIVESLGRWIGAARARTACSSEPGGASGARPRTELPHGRSEDVRLV